MAARSDWVVPVVGTAAALLFTSAFVTTLRVVRGFLAARDAAFDPPQAILVLGGDKQRERLAAKFAVGAGASNFTTGAHAGSVKLLPVYLSSAHDDAYNVMRKGGLHPARLHVDNRALDTVTNFTTMVDTFEAEAITHVFVVTSDYHMRRASLLANLVLRSRGIAFTPISLPSSADADSGVEAETRTRAERDRVRVLLWLLCGWHGAELLRFTRPNRYREHKKKLVQ